MKGKFLFCGNLWCVCVLDKNALTNVIDVANIRCSNLKTFWFQSFLYTVLIEVF